MLNSSKWKMFLCEKNTENKRDIDQNTAPLDANEKKQDVDSFDSKTGTQKKDQNNTIEKRTRGISKYELDVAFLLCNGINPSVLDLPLYYPEINKMVQISKIPKENKFFETENLRKHIAENDLEDLPTYPTSDKIEIKDYTKEMLNPDEYTNNVTFVKKYGDTHSLTVNEYIEKIYNYSENQEALDNSKNSVDLEDKHTIMQNLVAYKDQLHAEKMRKQQDALEAIKDIPNIDLQAIENRTFDNKKISTILVNRKLKGWTDDDLEILNNSLLSYLNWEDNCGSKFLSAIPEIIRSKDIPNANDILKLFNTAKVDWYRKELTDKELDKAIKKWWKDTISNSNKTESVELTEFAPKPKLDRIKEPGAVADMLVKLGIDPKYLIVPFTIKGTYDKNNIQITPDRQYRIVGFNDGEKVKELPVLHDKLLNLRTAFLNAEDSNEQRNIMQHYQDVNKKLNTLNKTVTAVVKEYDKGQVVGMPMEMNLAEIYKYIKATDALNVKEHDLANPNENLNQHKFHYVNLSPEVIQKMVDEVHSRYKNEIPYGYTIPPLLTSSTYMKYLDTPAMSIVLNLYNDEENSNYRIRKFGKTYKGLVPYNPNSKMNNFPNKSLKTMVGK